MSELKEVVVDAVVDLTCPCGWVGKRKLEMAIEHTPDRVVTVNWRPYFCRPNLPREGCQVKMSDDMSEKIGHINQAAKSIGIEVNAKFARAHNTLYAQCLLSHALTNHGWEVQNALLEKIYYAHFTEDRPFDVESLVDIVQSMDGPLDPSEVRQMLESGELEKSILEEAAMHSGNMPGVPSFFFNGEQGCSGAQEASAFMQMLMDA